LIVGNSLSAPTRDTGAEPKKQSGEQPEVHVDRIEIHEATLEVID